MIDALIFLHSRAHELPYALTTLMGWTTQVIAIDTGTDDEAAAVANRYGARVVRLEGQDRRDLSLLDVPWMSEWFFHISPEEFVTPALRDELRAAAARGDAPAYAVRRKAYDGGRLHDDPEGRADLRLFRRGAAASSRVVLAEPLLYRVRPPTVPQPRSRPGILREAAPGTFAERFGHLVPRGQRVIVTGGSGFIGSNLVEFYHQAGAHVVNLDHGPPLDARFRHLWRGIDLLDREGLAAKVRDYQPELFLHVAARTDLREKYDPAGFAANITGIENVLSALEGLTSLRRIVVTSTQLVCPLGYQPKHDEDYCPHTTYGQSKVATERLTRLWEKAPCPWTLVRPTSIWGPGFEEPYRRFFLSLARRRYVHQGDSNPLRSFGFVGNIVYEYAAVARAPESAVAGKTFYFADFEPVRVRDWAELITREMGLPSPRRVPLRLLRAAAKVGDLASRAGWKSPPLTSFRLRNMLSNSVNDTSPLKAVIGELPYGLEEGVRMTVKWLKEVGLINVPGRD